MAKGDRKIDSLGLPGEVATRDDQRVEEFVRLFTTHEVRLRAFAMTLLADHADVEDVLQQASLTLWAKFDDFTIGTNFMAWAGRVLYLKVQQFRRRQRREKLKFGDAYQEAILREAVQGEMADELGDRERALAECIRLLRAEQREMLQVRYDEQQSMEQMAERFNRSRDAIYNVLSRIRRALYDCVTNNVQAKLRNARR